MEPMLILIAVLFIVHLSVMGFSGLGTLMVSEWRFPLMGVCFVSGSLASLLYGFLGAVVKGSVEGIILKAMIGG